MSRAWLPWPRRKQAAADAAHVGLRLARTCFTQLRAIAQHARPCQNLAAASPNRLGGTRRVAAKRLPGCTCCAMTQCCVQQARARRKLAAARRGLLACALQGCPAWPTGRFAVCFAVVTSARERSAFAQQYPPSTLERRRRISASRFHSRSCHRVQTAKLQRGGTPRRDGPGRSVYFEAVRGRGVPSCVKH